MTWQQISQLLAHRKTEGISMSNKWRIPATTFHKHQLNVQTHYPELAKMFREKKRTERLELTNKGVKKTKIQQRGNSQHPPRSTSSSVTSGASAPKSAHPCMAALEEENATEKSIAMKWKKRAEKKQNR